LGAPDLPTIKNLRMFFDLGEALGLTSQKSILILNKMDKRFGITAERVADLLKQPVVSQIPLDDKTVPLSTNNGEPFVLADRTKPIARSILELSQAIKNRLTENKPVPLEEKKTGALRLRP